MGEPGHVGPVRGIDQADQPAREAGEPASRALAVPGEVEDRVYAGEERRPVPNGRGVPPYPLDAMLRLPGNGVAVDRPDVVVA